MTIPPSPYGEPTPPPYGPAGGYSGYPDGYPHGAARVARGCGTNRDRQKNQCDAGEWHGKSLVELNQRLAVDGSSRRPSFRHPFSQVLKFELLCRLRVIGLERWKGLSQV